jgi:Mg/Co/Ni transporter MgtE
MKNLILFLLIVLVSVVVCDLDNLTDDEKLLLQTEERRKEEISNVHKKLPDNIKPEDLENLSNEFAKLRQKTDGKEGILGGIMSEFFKTIHENMQNDKKKDEL